jgi:Family of unknown function (DUF5683)
MTSVKTHFFKRSFLAWIVLAGMVSPVFAQQKEKFVTADSLTTTTVTVDSTKNGKKTTVRVYNPRVATIRSAIFPGLGQIYNRKYWKLPIVYGALGISAGVFFYNLKNYKDTRFAYQAKYNASLPGATAADTAELAKIKPKLQRIPIDYLKVYRDGFRKDIDYSVLVFLLLWGLNVVDATVDAHLKAFDVSPDLSLKFKAGHSKMAGTNGVSLVLAFRH